MLSFSGQMLLNLLSKNDSKFSLRLLQKAKRENVHVSGFSPEVETKFAGIVEHVVDYLADELVGGVAKHFQIDNLELPKSIATFLIVEKCKECFVPKINQGIARLSKAAKSIKQVAGQCFKRKGNSADWLEKEKTKHDELVKTNLANTLKEERIVAAKERKRVIEEERRVAAEERARLEQENKYAKADELADNVLDKELNQLFDSQTVINDNELLEYRSKVAEAYKGSLRDLSAVELEAFMLNPRVDRGKLKIVTKRLGGKYPFPAYACPICAMEALSNIP